MIAFCILFIINAPDISHCEADYQYVRRYPPLVNSDEQTELAVEAASLTVGREKVDSNTPPITGAEDFAFLAREASGCFFWLGAGIAGDQRSHHSPRFDIDESCLPRGAAAASTAARQVLAEW